MHAHWFRVAFGAQFRAMILEIAQQLFLLGID